MADINGVTLAAGSSPVVNYTIMYTKSRPNNSQMTYNFTISAALGSSSSYINAGYALLCTITVNDGSGQVRIKANDNDNWSGTTPRVKTVSVTCTSTTANAAQAVTFKVVSDGRVSLSSGVITNSSYTVTSSALLYSACGAPSSVSATPNPFENSITVSWSGASSGTNNSISSYEIQYATSSNNSSWGAWTALTTVTTTATSGSCSASLTPTRGYYVKFQVRTRGAAGSSYYSGWREGGTIRRNSAPNASTSFSVSKTVYNQGDSISLSWSGASDTDNNISKYMIEYQVTTGGVWGSWYSLVTVTTTAASGSTTVTPTQAADGEQIRYRIKTVDAFSVESGYITGAAITRDDYTGVKVGLSEAWVKSYPYVGLNGAWVRAELYIGSSGSWVKGTD